jgi:parallel beta-helix repeat protein
MRVGFEVISTTEPAPNLQVGTPVFTPEHGNLYVATPGTEITITATNATSIRYTLDNSMPSCSTGVVYSNTTKPKITTVNMTLKAVACNNSSVSAVNSRWYTVDTPHSTLFNFSDIRGGVGDDANGFDVKKYITPTPVDAVYVKSKAEFEQAVASSSGKYNYIVLKDGVYDLGKQYIYRTKGVYTYIRAEHPGCYDPVNGLGVTLNGKTEFYVYNDGWTIEGLCFDGLKNADSAGYNFTKAIWILAGNVVVSQNVFKNFGNATDDLAAAILVGGKSNFEGERKTIAGTWIVRNHFSNIKGLGVDFPTPHPSYTGPYLWSRTPHVQYNTFEKSPLVRENGGEAIHLGTGWPMDASFDHNMRAVIQYNYFNEWNGDGELIGIKSSFNTVLGNLINNSGGGISVRYGDNNTIENNYMLGNPDATCALRSSGYGNVFKGNKLDLASSQIALCITAKHKEPGLDPYGRSAYQTVASKNTYFQSNVIKNSQNFVWLLKYGSVYPLDHYPPTIDDIPSGNQIRSNTLVNMSQAVKFKNDSIPEFGITDKMLLDNNFIE